MSSLHFKTKKRKIESTWETMQKGQFEIPISNHTDEIVKRDNKLKVPTNASFNVHQDLSSDWVDMEGIIFHVNGSMSESIKTWQVTVKLDEDWIPFVRSEILYRTTDGATSVNDVLAGVELKINYITQLKDVTGSTRIKEVTFNHSVHVIKANLPDFQVKRVLVIFNPNLYI